MKPQNTSIWSPALLHKVGSVRASRDIPGSSWATCSCIQQHLELNSCSLVFKGNLLYIINPFAESQWEESEYIFFTSAYETFINIGENSVKLSLLKVKQAWLSQPLTLSDVPMPETSLWAFSAFAPVHPCLSCTRGHKTGSRTPDVIWQLLNREARSPPSTCWLRFCIIWVGSWEHCLLMLNLLSSRNDICPSLPSCFPHGQRQAWCMVQNLVSPFIKELEFLVSLFISPSAKMPLTHLQTQLLHRLFLPVLYCVQTCWGGTAPLPSSLVKTLSSTGPCVTSCGWSLVTGLQMEFLQHLNSFSVHLNVHLAWTASVCLWRCAERH